MANGYQQSSFGASYILKSRLLAVGCLLLLINTLISIAAAFLPFWFEITVGYWYGSEAAPRLYVQKWGLFTMGADSFSSVVQMEKVLTGPTLPDYIRVAQILYLLGTCTTAVCAGTSMVLCLYRYGVLAAEMALACVTTGAAFSMILGVLFAFLLTELDLDMNDWNQFPLTQELIAQKAYPFFIKIDWAFGIACVSALLEIVAAVLFFIHACISCKGIETIRRQQVNGPNKYKPIPEPDVKLRIPPPAVPVQTLYQPSYPSRGFDPTMAVGHEGMVISRNEPVRVEPHYRSEPLSTGYPSAPLQSYGGASISEEVTI